MEHTLTEIITQAAIWATVSIAAGLAMGKAMSWMLDDDGLDGCEGKEDSSASGNLNDVGETMPYRRVQTSEKVWKVLHDDHSDELELMESRVAQATPGLFGKRYIVRYGFTGAAFPIIETEIFWRGEAEREVKIQEYWLCVPV